MTTLAPDAFSADQVSELDARALAAKHGGLREYAKAVHNLDIEPYQEAWALALEEMDRVVIICPPDTFKSTTVQLWIEQLIGRDPDERVLWLMNASQQAEGRVDAIKKTIEENEVYKRAFGIQKDGKWNSQQLFVKRLQQSPDPTLMGTGIFGPYQGLHFKRIVIDDPTDQQDVRSPTVMQSQRDQIRGVIIDRLKEGGSLVVIMTRWSDMDLVPLFMELGFTVIQMPVVGNYPWGPTISNTRFPMSRIPQLRKDKGDVMFELTFMCDVKALKGQLIKREHLRYWERADIPLGMMPLYMYIDPAASTKTAADYSSIATVGYDYQLRRCLLVDLWWGRLEVPDFRELVRQKALTTAGVMAVGVETVAYQLSLLQDLKRMLQIPVVEVPYRSRRNVQEQVLGIEKDKFGRALFLDQKFTTGKVLLPHGLPMVDGVSFEQMLMSYGAPTNTQHDDPCDALVGAVVLAEASMPSEMFVDVRA